MKVHMKASTAATKLLKAKHAVRSDVNRFKFLMPEENFSNLSQGDSALHPLLLEGLQENNYMHLTNL